MADPNWRKRLTPVLSDAVTLVSTLLGPNSTFLETLAQTQCLTEDQSDEISRICSREGQTQAARHLFGILRKRPKPYFEIFCDVLGKVDQGEDLLRRLVPERTSAAKSKENEDIDDYLDTKVSRDEKIEAGKRIQSYWRRVGRILGPEPLFEEYQLHGFQENRDDRDRAQAMLEAWTHMHASNATRRCLIRAMEEEDHAADAAKIFSKYSKPITSERAPIYNSDEQGGSGLHPQSSPQLPVLQSTVHQRRTIESKNESQSPEGVSDKKTPGPVDGSSFLSSHAFKWCCLLVFIAGVFAVGSTFISVRLPPGNEEMLPFPPEDDVLGPRGRGKEEEDSGASRRRQEATERDDYLDEEVTDSERLEASIQIQSCWQEIARILDPKPFQDYEIPQFEQKRSLREQALAMLDYWANAQYPKATRRRLIRAMKKKDLAKAAARVFQNTDNV